MDAKSHSTFARLVYKLAKNRRAAASVSSAPTRGSRGRGRFPNTLPASGCHTVAANEAAGRPPQGGRCQSSASALVELQPFANGAHGIARLLKLTSFHLERRFHLHFFIIVPRNGFRAGTVD